MAAGDAVADVFSDGVGGYLLQMRLWGEGKRCHLACEANGRSAENVAFSGHSWPR